MTIVKLQYKIEVNGQSVEEIEVRRPKVGDLKFINQGSNSSQIDEDIKLLSRLCTPTITHLDFEKLDVVDYQALGEALKSFLLPTPVITGN